MEACKVCWNLLQDEGTLGPNCEIVNGIAPYVVSLKLKCYGHDYEWCRGSPKSSFFEKLLCMKYIVGWAKWFAKRGIGYGTTSLGH